MGDRRPFKIEQEFASEFHLCDNEWHRVKIVFLEEEITLFVDDQNKMYWLSDNGHITEAETNSAFYIGGLPGIWEIWLSFSRSSVYRLKTMYKRFLCYRKCPDGNVRK